MKEINSNIQKPERISKTQAGIKKNKESLEQKPDFQEILTKKIDSSAKNDIVSNTASSLQELDKTFTPKFEKQHLDNTYFPDKIENILDMLDTYSLWLKDNNKTLKSVFPLLTDMEEKIKALDEELNEEKNPDNQLKQIVNQLQTTVHSEQIKMQRGDYLES